VKVDSKFDCKPELRVIAPPVPAESASKSLFK